MNLPQASTLLWLPAHVVFVSYTGGSEKVTKNYHTQGKERLQISEVQFRLLNVGQATLLQASPN